MPVSLNCPMLIALRYSLTFIYNNQYLQTLNAADAVIYISVNKTCSIFSEYGTASRRTLSYRKKLPDNNIDPVRHTCYLISIKAVLCDLPKER